MPRPRKSVIEEQEGGTPSDPLEGFTFYRAERNRFPGRHEHTVTINTRGMVSISGDLGKQLVQGSDQKGWVVIGCNAATRQIAIRSVKDAEGAVRVSKPVKGSRYTLNGRSVFEQITQETGIPIISDKPLTIEASWVARGEGGAVIFIMPDEATGK